MIYRLISLSKRVSILISVIVLCLASNAHGSVQYTVKKGDSLSKIAKKFKVNAGDIRKENELGSNKLKPGTRITIPVHEAKVAKGKKGRSRNEGAKANGESVKDDGEQAAAKDTAHTPEKSYHIVRKGESFRTIAKKYSITEAELKELNGLKSLRVKRGQRLLVKRTGPKIYVVKRGDSIRKIAKKFDMDENDLMELNEMETPEIRVGQTLYLEEKVDTAQVETYKEKISKIEEDLKTTAASEDFVKEDPKDKVITFAKKLLNIPYKFGGNSILGIDCSAYVKKVYGLLGVQLPRTAREQYAAAEGDALDKDQLSIGDLVFFRTYASFPSHVGIYLGNNLFIHASSRGKKVTIDSLETPYYLKRFIGGKRYLSEDAKEPDQKG